MADVNESNEKVYEPHASFAERAAAPAQPFSDGEETTGDEVTVANENFPDEPPMPSNMIDDTEEVGHPTSSAGDGQSQSSEGGVFRDNDVGKEIPDVNDAELPEQKPFIPPIEDTLPPQSAGEYSLDDAFSGEKKNYSATAKPKDGRAKIVKRSNILFVIFGSVAFLLVLFMVIGNIKTKKKEAQSIDKAGTVYIPDLVKKGVSAAPNTEEQPAAGEEAEDAKTDDEILDELENENFGAGTGTQKSPPPPQQTYGTSPVAQQQTSSGGGGGSGGGRPETNRNPIQKAVTRMPWTQTAQQSGQTSQARGNGTSSNPYAQFGLPAKEDYVANAAKQLQSMGLAGSGAAGTGYAAQNNQSDKQSFAQNGAGAGGQFQWNSDYSLWKGTVIPAVLQTAINSDLPGAVVARVTRNVYSSLDGRYLLIPEGSLLYAEYNSNISYNQSRVQIAWSTLIRPDGFEISLGNMQGIDMQGMTGQHGHVSEHFMEYLKAMGVVSAFTIANGELDNAVRQSGATEAQNSYTNNLIQENRNVINQLGAKMIDRAMDIQPTITVAQGTEVNVLMNVTMELPPLDPYPVAKKWERK